MTITAETVVLFIAAGLCFLAGLFRYVPLYFIWRGLYKKVGVECTGYEQRTPPNESRIQEFPVLLVPDGRGGMQTVLYKQAGRQFAVGRIYTMWYHPDRKPHLYYIKDKYRMVWAVMFLAGGVLFIEMLLLL